MSSTTSPKSHQIFWQSSFDQTHTWYWTTEPLSNGWAAVVADHSQSSAPAQATSYVAGASCQWWVLTDPRRFGTLSEAKTASLDLVMAQLDASPDKEKLRTAFLQEDGTVAYDRFPVLKSE